MIGEICIVKFMLVLLDNEGFKFNGSCLVVSHDYRSMIHGHMYRFKVVVYAFLGICPRFFFFFFEKE